MTERVTLSVNGKPLSVPFGTLVAAAVALAGVTGFRRSLQSESRGPVCGMGVCFECRVTINGQPHCRSCLRLCEEGMEVRTDEEAIHNNMDNYRAGILTAGEARARSIPEAVCNERATKPAVKRPSESVHVIENGLLSSQRQEVEVLVVGAGPAGMAAACVAAEAGRNVVLLDNSPWVGGQIWRGEQAQPAHAAARRWIQRLRKSGARVFAGATAFAAPGPRSLLAETPAGVLEIAWQRLILATGARELLLPFPGWTLPGVLGPGGLHAMSKAGWPVTGKRVVVAGTGPLLLAVAGGLKQKGARVCLVAEQAPTAKVVRFGLGLWRQPGKLLQGFSLKARLLGVPYRCGCWPVKAEGADHVERVTLTDGARAWNEDCDYLACGFHLVPNVELPRLVRCELRAGAVCVNEFQETTVANVYCAGEPTGVGGADCALVEGRIAGLAAAGLARQASAWFRQRASWHRFRDALNGAFALRPELRRLAAADTIVCRCEDVRREALGSFDNWRAAKLHTRCGMGACQGRVCGAATEFLFGWDTLSVRPPVFSVSVGALVSAETSVKYNSTSMISQPPV